jgi:hypothetical protein
MARAYLLITLCVLAGCPESPPGGGDDLAGADLSVTGDLAGGVPTMSFFITSMGGSGNLGGLTGADARCTQLAEAAGVMGRTWHAYLSNANPAVNARDRIGTGPWYNAKGVKIADDVDALHDPDLSNGRNNVRGDTALDERGAVVPGRTLGRDGGAANEHDIVTGSDAMGRLPTDGACAANNCTCNDWMSAGAGRARVGHFDRDGGGTAPMSWNSAHESSGCSQANFVSTGGNGRIYCFAL